MTRKRSRYRPKPVISDPLSLMRPASQSQRDKVMLVFLTALDAIAHGKHPGQEEWRQLADCLNTLETLALHQGKLIPGEVMPMVDAAAAGMVDAAKRFADTGTIRVSGMALEALRDAVSVYDQCLTTLTEREMAMAQAETQRRVHALQRSNNTEVVSI
ncbi:MAG: hypothetical protein ACRCV9_02140 [Burkholderiaceae bacterium]